MTDYFVSQSGAGSEDGSSAANAWAYADIPWGTVANNVLYIVGTITSNFSVGAHGSNSVTPLQIRGDYPGNAGDVDVASGNAVTIPGNTNRNHTHFYGLSVNSANSNGFRIQSGVGLVGRRWYNCTSSGNGSSGFSFQNTSGHDYTDIVMDGCTISSNGLYAVSCIIPNGNSQSYTDWTIQNCTANLNASDCFRITPEAGNQVATIDNFVFYNNKMYNNGMTNGGRGLRFGAATHLHNTGNGALITYNTAIGNGKDGNQGGGLDIRSCAGDPAGSIGDTDQCYIAYNRACGNHGENGGINVYGALNGVVEWNVCNDQYVSETDNAAPNGPVIDGNGIIMDANSDHMECRYNSCSRNKGSSAVNSGAGIMVLFDTLEVHVHHNWGYGNKYGLWSQSNTTQEDILFENNTFLECEEDGFRYGNPGDPQENILRNCLFTGVSGSDWGIENVNAVNLGYEDYNLFYGFDSGASTSNGGLGSNSITTQPTFAANVTYEDDGSGTATTQIQDKASSIWEFSAEGEGERVIEVDGSGDFITTANGGGAGGTQSMMLATDQGDPDHYIQLTMASGWTTETTGIYGLLRFTDIDNCIVVRVFGTGAGGLAVRSRIGGTETTLTGLTTQPEAGSVYRVECYTETVALYKDGTLINTARVLASSLDPLATRVGMGAFQVNASPTWTNFESGVLLPEMRPLDGDSPQVGAGVNGTYGADPDELGHVTDSWPIGAYDINAGGGTVPTLSNNTASSITAGGCTPQVDTDVGNGTLYMTVGPDGESSWRTDIVAGVLRDQSPALASESIAVTTTGTQTFSAITSLDPATNYELQFVHVSASDDMSLKAFDGFTTSASATPSLSSPTAGSVTEDSVTPSVTTDTANGVISCVVVPDGDSPSVAQIKAGEQSNGNPAIGAATVDVTTAGAYSLGVIDGLDTATAYELFFVHTTNEDVDSSSATVGFTTTASAPVLTSPAAGFLTEISVVPSVRTDTGNGTIYMVVVPDGDVPSAAQIKAGLQSNGLAAIGDESAEPSTSGLLTFTEVSGLSPDTNYEIYFIQTSSVPLDSEVVTVGFSTTGTDPEDGSKCMFEETAEASASQQNTVAIDMSGPSISERVTQALLETGSALLLECGGSLLFEDG